MKKFKWVIIIVVGVMIFSAGKFLFKNKSSDKSQESVFVVKRGDVVVAVNVTGTIKPLKVVELKSKASGKIVNMPVEQGDYLKEGELVCEIEKTFTLPAVEQAKAELDASISRLEKIKMQIEFEKQEDLRQLKSAENSLALVKLKLAQLEIGSRPEEIKRAQSSLEKAKSNLDLIGDQYDRMSKLNEKGFVSKDEFESQKAKLESAKSDYELALQSLEIVKQPSTKEDLDMMKLQVKQAELDLSKARQDILAEKAREQDIVIAEADVVKQRVALKLAEDNLKDTRITAPISGTILEKSVEEGQVISSGMSLSSTGTTIAKMANLARVYIDANVDETDIGKVMVKQLVKIVVDAFPKEVFNGVIIRIAPQGVIVQNVTTFEITVEIKNPSAILKPSMNASLEVVSAERRDVLFVPNDAIKLKDGKEIVSVLQDGRPVSREVETGISNWEWTEIVSGLKEGDVVSKSETKVKKNSDTTRRPPGLFGR